MSEVHTVPPWTRLPCDECGVEFQASRTAEATGPFVCSDCEMYERGRRDGIVDALGECLSVAASSGSGAECVRRLEALVRSSLGGPDE